MKEDLGYYEGGRSHHSIKIQEGGVELTLRLEEPAHYTTDLSADQADSMALKLTQAAKRLRDQRDREHAQYVMELDERLAKEQAARHGIVLERSEAIVNRLVTALNKLP